MSVPDNAIAVVGMAGRFPGAKNVSAFWDNLRRGKESIVTLSEQQLRDAGISDKALANPAYVRRAPIVDGVDDRAAMISARLVIDLDPPMVTVAVTGPSAAGAGQ